MSKKFLSEDKFKPPLDFYLMRSKVRTFGEQAQIEVNYELVKNTIVNAQILKILEIGEQIAPLGINFVNCLCNKTC